MTYETPEYRIRVTFPKNCQNKVLGHDTVLKKNLMSFVPRNFRL